MSTTTNDITAAQWLDIRDHVAQAVKAGSSPQTRFDTCVNVAEKLLRNGIIDIDAVVEKIKPKTVEEAAKTLGLKGVKP